MAVEFLKAQGVEMTGPPLRNIGQVSKVEQIDIPNSSCIMLKQSQDRAGPETAAKVYQIPKTQSKSADFGQKRI